MDNTFFIFYAPFIVIALTIVAAFVVATKTSDDY